MIEESTKGQLPWRVGRSVGRTIYDAHDQLLGVMDEPWLAAQVVTAVNERALIKAMQQEPYT